MTQPLIDQQCAAIEAGRTALRARFAGGAFPAALGHAIADELADVAMAPALAELERQDGEARFWEFEYRTAMDNYKGEAEHGKQLRVERDGYRDQVQAVAQVRCWTNEDGRSFLFADDVRTALAAPACSCAAEIVHQRGCQPNA